VSQEPREAEHNEQEHFATYPPGLYSESGQIILESLPAGKIAMIGAIDARITYIPFQIPQEKLSSITLNELSPNNGQVILNRQAESLFSMMNSFGVDGNAINHFVIPGMEDNIEQLMKQLGMHSVGLRGIACSVDGIIDKPATPPYKFQVIVRDIGEIMSRGTEGTESETAITVFEGNQDDNFSPQMHHRTRQWLVEHPRQLKVELSGYPDEIRKIYPMLLVYDLDKLEPGNRYNAKLRSGLNSWSESLIKAYVIPSPTNYKSPYRYR